MSTDFTIAPIIVLAYNRPQMARAVLEKLYSLGITQCYVSIDGAKRGNIEDIVAVESTLKVVQEISKVMKISVKAHSENLGCYKAVTSGIDWFFKNVEFGIILEDDLEFDRDLLIFLSQQLIKYKDQATVGSISGFRDERFKPLRNPPGQIMSRFPSSWGWATWADRWQRFEHEMNVIFTLKLFFALLSSNRILEFPHWAKVQRRLRKGELDSWAYRWLLSHILRQWKVLVPSLNLVTNLGFSSEATHTKDSTTRTFTRGKRDILEANPTNESRNYDDFLVSKVYGYTPTYTRIKNRALNVSKNVFS